MVTSGAYATDDFTGELAQFPDPFIGGVQIHSIMMDYFSDACLGGFWMCLLEIVSAAYLVSDLKVVVFPSIY